ncbi:uncharacterized protein LOC131032462 [Cryptomeria japonica]|uniref:uncharacterized protein LOC131032462 n=1 Tax=Cryptomeria japonica TaxID=3369 RepID=UPI0027DA223F|nr:uncharacterized protein LOC131032462 [Cryptomeria japonica]
MFLLDFEKAYDRIEWGFISMMLDAFGFPSFFCDIVKMLLRDAHAQIDINGSLSTPFPLGRSIRQGCPLAPGLFVIASEALFYILRDNTLSPAVKGITLPDNKELINCQFADDTSLFHEWGGPSNIVRYLGIPFSVDPSLKDMWSWVKDKIHNKLNKWHNRSLSFAGRVQVCQKILSSYNIYYASAWMFNDYQVMEIQKAIRKYLWSDGKGNNKAHFVKWSWCHVDKLFGGLGLKDLRLSGLALASKWIFHALEGDDPWRVLIRNNIERGYPKNAKFWKNLPLTDLICSEFAIIVQGSAVFKSIWKAWNHVRQFIKNKDFFDDKTLHGERSIWWNLKLGNKPLALTQGCSAKCWANLGIKQLIDIFENDRLIHLDELKSKFNLSDSHKRTYNMIVRASRSIPNVCHVDSNSYQKIKWPGGIIISGLKSKNIYSIININNDIIKHINDTWNYFSETNMCSICRTPETGRHIFFECSFAKEIQITMTVNKAKFKRLLRDGHATFFTNEVKNGYFWRLHLDNIRNFNLTFDRICKEIKRNPQCTTGEMLYMWKQIQDQKNLVSMEGALGWTAWVDSFEDVLH